MGAVWLRARAQLRGSFLVQLDPDADHDGVIARLRREFGGYALAPRPHADIRNLQRIAALPSLVAAMVALVALGTMTHALVTSVRRRRRDLAVLKTLGFVRPQVAATIAWQATTFAVVAPCLGLPLGVTAGRWAWQLTASSLGVSSSPALPLLAMAIIAVGTVVAANLVAAVPGAGGEPAAAGHGAACRVATRGRRRYRAGSRSTQMRSRTSGWKSSLFR